MSTPVTEEHVEQYRENGYVVVEDAFSETEVERMRSEADRVLELLVNSSLAHDRKSGRLDIVADDDGEQMVRKVQPVDDLSMTFTGVEADERIQEMLRALMDDEPELMEEKLNYKQPLPEPTPLDADRASSAFPVHNDWAYYKAQDYPEGIVSTAVLLDDFTPDNGPLHVWPGTHGEHVEHEHVEGLGLQVPADEMEGHGDGEDLLCEAGSVLFFSSLLVHSSRPNTSGDPRRLMIYSHYPASEGEDVEFDERNGPARFHESPYEWEYQRLKETGEFEDQFEAPDVD
jgi:ectoine hydroxylase-related dioxygenase (phytanoyl-CoA dioxygenase family)